MLVGFLAEIIIGSAVIFRKAYARVFPVVLTVDIFGWYIFHYLLTHFLSGDSQSAI